MVVATVDQGGGRAVRAMSGGYGEIGMVTPVLKREGGNGKENNGSGEASPPMMMMMMTGRSESPTPSSGGGGGTGSGGSKARAWRAARRPSAINSETGLHPGLVSLEQTELMQQRRVMQRAASVPGSTPQRVLEKSGCRRQYIEACENFGVAPSSQVLKLLGSRSLCVRNYGLKEADARSIGRALQVYSCPVGVVILQGNRIGAAGAAALCEGIQRSSDWYANPGVTQLDLRDNGIRFAPASMITSSMSKRTAPSPKERTTRSGSHVHGDNNDDKYENAQSHEENTCSTSSFDDDSTSTGGGGGSAADALANLFESTSCRLEIVKLGGNSFSLHGLRRVSAALARCETLIELELGACKLGDDAGRAIGDILVTNRSISRLYLGWNSIGAVGLRHIVRGIVIGDCISEFSIEFNCIGAAGCTHIARLARNKNLRLLDLGYNAITADGIDSIASAFTAAGNSALQRLVMDGNLIGDVGVRRLIRIVRSRRNTIRDISAGSCGAGATILDELRHQCIEEDERIIMNERAGLPSLPIPDSNS